LGARLLGPRAGLGAAGALLSSALFVVFGRYVRPETLFVAAIQWGLAGLLLGLAAPAESGRRRVWLLVGCAGLALASLAKDPLGLIGPLGPSPWPWHLAADPVAVYAAALRRRGSS
jgi:4-amino-4-deoxy-L-arabinose transferase-like glycosyltransferase